MKLIYGKSEEDFIECDKAVKGEDFIKCYVGDDVVAEFDGVSDFSGYELKDGEYTKPQLSELEELKQYVELLSEALDEILVG